MFDTYGSIEDFIFFLYRAGVMVYRRGGRQVDVTKFSSGMNGIRL